jgi:uncharacterized protein (TIGR03067 family)
MRHLLSALLVVGTLVAAVASADDAKDKAIKKDRQRIEGTWQLTALKINGNQSKQVDTQKLRVVNGSDGTWSVRSEGKEISKGSSTFDPTKKPKAIDFTPTEGGGTGEKFLGIYQLRKNTRKLCFAPSGKDRPTKFSSTADNQHILVTLKREEAE